MQEKILIIEDESPIAETISYSLETEGFTPFRAATGKEGLKIFKQEEISLIILDIGLPDTSGFDLLKEIRLLSEVPVIFLTARAEELDRILGLELGADDYVTKPFSPRELSARVKAIFRRISKVENLSEKSVETPFLIDEKKRLISYFGRKLNLTRYEYEILILFTDRPGWIFSREQIMDLIWNEPEESFDRTVDTHIKTIRAKLKKIKPDVDSIITHRGIGYSLNENL